MRAKIKKLTPAPLLNALRDTRDSLEIASEYPLARFHPWRIDSIRKLETLRDSHAGEQCVIIGNGPSLKNTALNRLKNVFRSG